jgi:hypothetical protein
VLGILVIAFAWVDASWASIALTVLGALVAAKALGGACCCAAKKEDANSGTSEAGR